MGLLLLLLPNDREQASNGKKRLTLDKWLGLPLSNETGRDAELSTDWRRLLQPKTTSFWLICRR